MAAVIPFGRSMIISKDLFLLGEQDYLRLPKDEKRNRLKSSNATIAANGAAPQVTSVVVGMGKEHPPDDLR